MKEVCETFFDLKEILDGLDKIKANIGDLKHSLKNKLELEKKTFSKLLDLLKNESLNLLEENFDKLISQAIINCENLEKNQNSSWTNILNEISNFRELFYKNINESILHKKELVKVLFEIIKYLPETDYIDLLMIVDQISSNLSLTKREVYSLISQLVEKKLIQLSISYPFGQKG